MAATFRLPRVGLGTWKASGGVVGEAVKTAVRSGYRLLDCAAAYGNESEVGDALAELFAAREVARDDLYVVSKCFQTHHVWDGEDRPRQALEKTLADLGLTHVDLYLIHWPFAFAEKSLADIGPLRDAKGTPNPRLTMREEYLDTWRSMLKLQEEGKTTAVGVSNFTVLQLENIRTAGLQTPAVNQVELHPYLQQPELKAYCDDRGIDLMAYSPLGSKDSYSGTTFPPDVGTTLLGNPAINAIAERHGKTAAQVLIRWSVQSGFCCIPKSADPGRIKANHGVLDWALAEEDTAQLKRLDRGFRYGIGYQPGHYDCANAPWGIDGRGGRATAAAASL